MVQSEDYETRLQRKASTVVLPAVEVVLFGSAESLDKRRTAAQRLRIAQPEVTVHILDDIDFGDELLQGEKDYAQRAAANVFIIDPHWRSFGPLHELTAIIGWEHLGSVVILTPDTDPPTDEDLETFTLVVGMQALRKLEAQWIRYSPESWPDCEEVSWLCGQEVRKKRALLASFPRTVNPPAQTGERRLTS